MKKAFSLSLILHIAIISLLGLGSLHLPGCGSSAESNGPEEEGQEGDKQGKAKDGKHKIGSEIMEITIIPAGAGGGEPCKDWYGGIGIHSDNAYSLTMTVLEVAIGYPADRAGIEAGDVLGAEEEVRGEIGKPVDVTVKKKDGREIKVTLVREKICTDKKVN